MYIILLYVWEERIPVIFNNTIQGNSSTFVTFPLIIRSLKALPQSAGNKFALIPSTNPIGATWICDDACNGVCECEI